MALVTAARPARAAPAKARQRNCVEVHGAGTQEIPHMRRIMEVADHPHVVVCWNCNAADLAGDGFDANFTALEPWMGTVHIHDLRPGKVDYPWELLFPKLRACTAAGFTGRCLLGDGSVPDEHRLRHPGPAVGGPANWDAVRADQRKTPP